MLPDVWIGDGLGGPISSIVVSILLVVVLVLLAVLVFDVLGVVNPLALAAMAADVELFRRLLRRAPFSVEASSIGEHVQFPVYGIRASREAIHELEARSRPATGDGSLNRPAPS